MELDPTQLCVELLKNLRIFNQKTSWLSIDKLWYDPEVRATFYNAFLSFWELNVDDSNSNIFIYPESLNSSFGILPFVSKLAFDRKKNLVIWKELGDLLTTTPKLFPEEVDFPKKCKCIILQDVLRKGTTIAKIEPILKYYNWTISYYVSVFQIAENIDLLNENISQYHELFSEDYKFVNLIKDKALQ